MNPTRSAHSLVSIARFLALLGIQSLHAQANDLPVLPPPAPIPAIPEPMPRDSVEMGDPDKLPEVKMDFPMAPGPFEPTWDSISAQYPADPPAWLRESKFGFWVHFGPQAAGMSGDWYAKRLYQPGQPAYNNHQKNYGHPSEFGYKDLLHAWNPKQLDPAAYVKLFHDAGARFLFIQGVHHDNFDLWNSKYQPWNSVNVGPKRDFLGEWSKAIRKAGMHYGVTFHHEYTWWWWESAFNADAAGPKAGVPYDGRLTLADGKGKWWEGLDPRRLYGIDLHEYKNSVPNPWTPEKGIFTRHDNYARWYVDQWALRMLDVIAKYDPDFIYTDGNHTQPFTGYKTGSGYKCDAMQRVMASYYNRTLAKRGKVDTFSIVKFHPPGRRGVATTFEGDYPHDIKTDQPWIGENAVGDWYYAPGFTYSAKAIVRFLLECVSRDGCYAVNIPMKPDGSIEDACVTMLKDLAAWMKINSPGIYGSKAWVKFGEGSAGANGGINTTPFGQLGPNQANHQFSTSDFRFTVGKDGSLYAYCLAVPAPGETLRINSLGKIANRFGQPISQVSLLGHSGEVIWKQTDDALEIACPKVMPFNIAVAFRIQSAR